GHPRHLPSFPTRRSSDLHPATGIAAEPTRCAVFSRAAIEAAIAEAPPIAFVIARRLALRVRQLVDRLDDRSARSVQARLIEFLRSEEHTSELQSLRHLVC